MDFKYIDSSLYQTADGTKKFLQGKLGLTKLKYEEPIRDDIGYAPTIHGKTNEGYLICVEIKQTLRITPQLNEFILKCAKDCLPVKIFIALPAGTKYKDQEIRKLKSMGIGLVVSDNTNTEIILNAASLHLIYVRQIPSTKFLKKYREKLLEAEETFKNGSPPKGCGILYDENEHLTRLICRKTIDKNYIRRLKPGEVLPKINPEKRSWAKVGQFLFDYFSPQKAKCPKLNKPLLGRVCGLTDYRNESSHKPKTFAALQRRDSRLRTRFESGFDVLLELQDGSKPMKP